MFIIPKEMSVVEIKAPGGPEQLCLAKRSVPVPDGDNVLIKVAAAGVNRPDVMQRLGRYPAPAGASDLPGLEVAGEIVALGPEVSDLAVGDRVTALLAGGGYASYAIAAAPLCLPVPEGFSMVEAAALPENFFTVWNNLFERAGLKFGESVLIHGGSSGIGTTAIQLAAAFGAQVFATAGSPEKVAACLALGATRGIDYRAEDFVSVIKNETSNRGVDVILDIIAGDYFQRNLEAAALDGRLAVIGVLGGPKVNIDVGLILRKRLTVMGSTLRARSVAQKGAIATALLANVWPLLASGRIRPLVHATFPLAEASQAHRLMEASTHIGKIVLTCE
ncbi:putative NAD(P)H quinone oxidoreductase, PIG3 family [Pseudomonas sp. NFACC52]|nr:putative NAD(P)H quinone oxidoreductase, PIG3 family [Pseudomonas sp. NFACC56-3]SFK30760.1 putative NAD(P)H quinone oxidoreductase, PIG3 family [Pseudomonas sp. NFACC52]